MKFFGGSKDDGDDLDCEVELDPAFLEQYNASRESLKNCRVEDFEVKQILGTGSFGRVQLVKHRKTGKLYALKALSKSLVLKTKQVEHIRAEKDILMAIKYPFIVNAYASFQDDIHLYLVLEYVIGGEFFTHLRKAEKFPNDVARFYAASVICTFEHLHNQNIIYRDLKPENLLLDRGGYLKVCDFGFAKKVDPTTRTYTLCGTPEYLAPEIILNKGHGKPVDWWAMGVLIYEMLVGYPPFFAEDRMALYQSIIAGRIDFPRHVNKHARDLITKLLTADLSRRIGNLKGGVKEIKKHAWFKGFDWQALVSRRLKAPIDIASQLRGDDDTSFFDEFYDDDGPEMGTLISAKDQTLFQGF